MFKKKKKKPKQKPKTWYGKTWHFLWHEDSFYSWIVNIVLAVLIIKFLVYPGIGLIFGTSYPIVAVVSGSMDHHGESFDSWWSDNKDFYLQKGITKQMFEEFPFRNGFEKGDLMILKGADKEDIEVGNVAVFISGKPYPIIHRVVEVRDKSFETKGDANKLQIQPPYDYQLDETSVSYDSVVGKAVFRIPLIGYVKIFFAEFLGVFGINIG